MAILMRRGAYADFDPSRMLPGEWAVVLSDAPDAVNGKCAYICFAAGDVKRIATVEDLETIVVNDRPEMFEALKAVLEEAATDTKGATADAKAVIEDTKVAIKNTEAATADAKDATQEARDVISIFRGYYTLDDVDGTTYLTFNVPDSATDITGGTTS